ncbi:MAG: aryl-sulfate sulfotransferase [Myxococcota bacterium]
MTLWLAWAACDGGEGPPAPIVAEVTCAPTDNALRFRCAVDTDGPTTWVVYRGDAAVRRFETDGSAVGVWGLAPEAEHRVEVLVAGEKVGETTLTTGALPAVVEDLVFTPFGAPGTVEQFAIQYRCGLDAGLALFDTAGTVLWYEPLEIHPSPGGAGPVDGIVGFDWSADDAIAAVLDGDRVRRFDPMGELQFEVQGFDPPLHHDVMVHGDRVVALFAYEQDGRVLDGWIVLDAAGAVAAEWRLGDAVPISGTGGGGPFWEGVWPDATDWSHSNGLSPDGPEHLLLSSRWQSAVLRIVADPASAEFGAVDWVLTGADTDLDSDFTWSDGGGFVGQHHATRRANGGVAVFDNAAGDADSRALFVDLDGDTAREAAAWSMGRHCGVMGGAYELPNGGVFATCSTSSGVAEFAPGQAEMVFGGGLFCGATPMPALNRARPVTLPR